ncbi:50S ribosomal protein L5 [Blattabacterium cuenoti]|uniref:50S ribosomal protein L5 n=1 Tax=Blattabacterium cuenoti TaxID=1653831 RepID=UPI00163CC0C6|nr:50S ribosomal protein L5 [Blattabacterium cuenoti]
MNLNNFSDYTPQLYNFYKKNVTKKLMKKFGYNSIMEVPKLLKIVIHQGIGSTYLNDKKILDSSLKELTNISGQKAIICYSKHDESGFKLRKGTPIGVKVTLRRDKMYEFLERLIVVYLPRVRDFNGLSNSGFDNCGNYNIGIKEQIIFPEINIDEIRKNMGMNITFVISTTKYLESKGLLSLLGIPFKKKN